MEASKLSARFDSGSAGDEFDEFGDLAAEPEEEELLLVGERPKSARARRPEPLAPLDPKPPPRVDTSNKVIERPADLAAKRRSRRSPVKFFVVSAVVVLGLAVGVFFGAQYAFSTFMTPSRISDGIAAAEAEYAAQATEIEEAFSTFETRQNQTISAQEAAGTGGTRLNELRAIAQRAIDAERAEADAAIAELALARDAAVAPLEAERGEVSQQYGMYGLLITIVVGMLWAFLAFPRD